MGWWCGAKGRESEQAAPAGTQDLPGYAVGLYDSYLAAPELVRLASWTRLDWVPTGNLLAGHQHLTGPKLEAIARAQDEGRIISDIRPEEVYSLVIALAGEWSPVSSTHTAFAAEAPAEHERRRTALRLVVSRALVP